ncbi:hypothetical protein TrRE_jg2112 [Triparma retinervis]|uniref:Uncharacterized protein n=1 Tax=Triparma retinervis TaxID=2557542 RepID=A0A9W7A3T5_9STRA|nr:hypothetical protein TrRE_jg2112 [Triparma retinervis]
MFNIRKLIPNIPKTLTSPPPIPVSPLHRTLSTVSPPPVTVSCILSHQSRWSKAITDISAAYLSNGDFVSKASKAQSDLYAYEQGDVIFKPTKSTVPPFRPTPTAALSYFVGAVNVPEGHSEDMGFAINSGSGWSSVTFHNSSTTLLNGLGFACGVYDFVCASSGDSVRVEYTKGYRRGDDGQVRLFLHHSSVPYGR